MSNLQVEELREADAVADHVADGTTDGTGIASSVDSQARIEHGEEEGVQAADVDSVHIPQEEAAVDEASDTPAERSADSAVEQVSSQAIEPLPTSPLPEVVDWQAAARQAVADATQLPPGVRALFTQRLADGQEALRDALGRPAIAISEALAWLSSSLPANWLQNPSEFHVAYPPHGEGFFTSGEGLSDERAEQIAQQQLAATGFLRPAA